MRLRRSTAIRWVVVYMDGYLARELAEMLHVPSARCWLDSTGDANSSDQMWEY